MQMEKQIFQTELAGKPLIVEVGQLAKQANGAALIRYGETVVLSVAAASKEAKDLDFFPLQVNYEEKLYSVGKIPGGFIKREGRPSEKAILASRLIDRPIRPLFAEGFRNEVQVISTVLSVDPTCSPEMAAMFGSSLALSISDIPFNGPIAGAHIGYINDEFVVNPSFEQLEKSKVDLVVAGTKKAINMVEAGAKEVSEEIMLRAIAKGHEIIRHLISFQEEIVSQVGREKMAVKLYSFDEELVQTIDAQAKVSLCEALRIAKKEDRQNAIDAINESVLQSYEETDSAVKKQVKDILKQIVKDEVRRLITVEKVRPDGRNLTEIRPLAAEIDLLPRTHGSGLFTRGQTQVLSIATLGALNEYQVLDGLDAEEQKRFMHHYNFPAYSVGETGRYGAPGRREIGHGALGERALKQVMPSEEEFPYTIRVVSEVLESNGSTSQASICAATMALMTAGVPIKAPVAGIAMGLIMSEDEQHYSVLTDIQGLEDHLGDMDFKVAGTSEGITALQMDIKISGITPEILEEALLQAKIGRSEILGVIVDAIEQPRVEVSQYAPKVKTLKIKVEKIRDVIGPGGKQINKIIEETGVKIDIEEDGTTFIFSHDSEMINKAIAIIERIVREVEVNEIYHQAPVKRIEKFGAFVELFEGHDALVHVSQISHTRVEKVEDVLKVGDKVDVIVTEIDDRGRANASIKLLLPKPEPVKEETEINAEK
ncbi:MAG: polyribonucleotide nucleotidyltransferase [Culicoidibacterales bacterium]